MQTAAQQVCWIPIDGISIGDENGTDDGEVFVRAVGDGRYTLLGGAGRVRALKRSGQTCVDAVVCSQADTERQLTALIEGLLTGKLTCFEEAEAYRTLISRGGFTRKELAFRLGRSSETIGRKLRLLALDGELRQTLTDNRLCERYAQALLRLPSAAGRKRALELIVRGKLSVREAEELIDGMLERLPIPVPKERRLLPAMRDHRLYVNAICGIVEQMRDAGLEVRMTCVTGPSSAELRIAVPRFGAKRR